MVPSHIVLFFGGMWQRAAILCVFCVIPWPVLLVTCCGAQVVHIVGVSVV